VTYYETSHQLTAPTVVSIEDRCTAHKLTKQLALTRHRRNLMKMQDKTLP